MCYSNIIRNSDCSQSRLSPIPQFFRCGGKSNSGGQKRCILKTHRILSFSDIISNCLKIDFKKMKVMMSGGITKDGLSMSMVDVCWI